MKLSVAMYLICICAVYGGCKTVDANYPPVADPRPAGIDSSLLLCEQPDLRVVRIYGAPEWFSAADFLRIKKEKTEYLRSKNAPEGQIKAFESVVQRVKGMELLMVDEDERFAFAHIGLSFAKSTILDIEQGAFILKVRSADGRQTASIADQGLLMSYPEGDSFRFQDSRQGGISVTWDMQRPDYSKIPNIIYLRVAKEYEGWNIESATIDRSKLVVRKR